MSVQKYVLTTTNEAGEKVEAYLRTSSDQVVRDDNSTVESALTTLNTSLAAIQEALNTLKGSGDGSVQNIVDTAISTVIGGAPETYDTLKELADWVTTHETDAAGLVTRIAALEANSTKWQFEPVTDDTAG